MKNNVLFASLRSGLSFPVLIALTLSPLAADLTDKLQKGLFEEEANHNLAAAIEQYQSVISSADEQRKIIATALYRLGECYRKLGKQKEADELYARLARDFSEQTQFFANKQSPAPRTSQAASSLNDFISSERLAVIQPDLINATVNRGRFQAVLNSVKALDPTNYPSILPIIYPSSLWNNLKEGELRSAKRNLAFLLQKGGEDDSKAEELRSSVAFFERSVQQQLETVLQDLAISLSNNIARSEKLGAERRQIFSALSADAALPLVQTLIRDILSKKQNLETQIDKIEGDLQQATTRGRGALVNYLSAMDRLYNTLHSEVEQAEIWLQPENYSRAQPKATQADKERDQAAVEILKQELQSREAQIRKGAALKADSFREAVAALDSLMKSAEADYRRATGEPPSSSREPNQYTSLMQLLDNSPDLLNAPATNNRTYLHHAAATGDVDLLQLLLQRGAVVNKASTGDGKTPLHIAVQQGHKKVAELLIKSGANVNAKDKDGATPLHNAAANGFTALSELLIENGASVNAQEKANRTALHEATQRGHLEEMQLLLRHGSDIDARGSSDATPLVIAAVFQQLAAGLLLLSSNAQVNVQDSYGNSPLSYAVSSRDWTTALLDRSADPNLQDRNGQTALIKCIIDKGDSWICASLLNAKADPNIADKNGRTAVHHAVLKDNSRILELLLDAGGDPNRKDDRRLTALAYAAGAKPDDDQGTRNSAQPQLMKILLERGATPGDAMWTALSYPDALKLLLEAKADPNVKTETGRTPLDFLTSQGTAVNRDQKTITIRELLLQYGATNTISPSESNAPSFRIRLNSQNEVK